MKTSSVPAPLLRTILICRKEFPTLSMSLSAAVTNKCENSCRVCVCVCERERERERGGGGDK